MAFYNKISKCVNVFIKIENKVCIASTSRNCRLTERKFHSSIIKESKNDLAKAGRFYSTETASITVVKEPLTAEDAPASSKPEPSSSEQVLINDQLIRALTEVDQRVRSFGRLGTIDLHRLLNKCRPGMSSTEAVMLIKCTGQLLKRESVEERKVIFQKVLDKVSRFCAVKTTEILNAEMAINIENEVDFDPANYLAMFDELDLTPTKSTFHLLLSQYCQQGNIDKALDILNHMKVSDWTISSSTIHSILYAYAKKGDKEECRRVMAEMSQNGLRPTSDTYLCLLRAHAANADVEAIKQVITEMVDGKIDLRLKESYDVLYKLVQSGHHDVVSEVMDVLGLTEGGQAGSTHSRGGPSHIHFQDTTNLVYQLFGLRQYPAAVLVLQSFSDHLDTRTLDMTDSNVVHRVFVRQLIDANVPVEDLYCFRERLVEANLISREWEPITYYALKSMKIESVLKLLEDIKDKSFQLKTHYLLPVLHRSDVEGNQEDLLKTTEFLLKNFSNFEITVTLFLWSFRPLLRHRKGDYKSVLEDYKEIGASRGLRDLIELYHMVETGMFAEALKLVQEGAMFQVIIMRGAIADGVVSDNFSPDEFFKFMRVLGTKLNRTFYVNGLFLEICIKRYPQKDSHSSLQSFVEAWIDADIKVEAGMLRSVQSLLASRGVPEDTIQRLQSISVQERNVRLYDSPLTSDLGNLDSDVDVRRMYKMKTTEKSSQKTAETTEKSSQKTAETTEKAAKETTRDHEDVVAARALLKHKKHAEFRTLVHKMSEKPDVDSMKALMKNITIPSILDRFFNRKLMMAHLNSGLQGDMEDSLQPATISSFISTVVLHKIKEKDVALLDKIDTMLREKSGEVVGTSAHISLYHFFLAENEVEKARAVMQSKPILKDLVRLGSVSYKALVEKNESMLRALVEMHGGGGNSKQTAICHSRLIQLKCQADDVRGAEEAYKGALEAGVVFGELTIRSLQALQTLLLSHQLPQPWKEGALEKRIESIAKPSSPSSSDSDSD